MHPILPLVLSVLYVFTSRVTCVYVCVNCAVLCVCVCAKVMATRLRILTKDTALPHESSDKRVPFDALGI